MIKQRRILLLASLMCLLTAGSSFGDGVGGAGENLLPHVFTQNLGERLMLAQASAAAEEREGDAAPQEGGLDDPLEPMNRAFFEFNDRLYFWVLKPVARGYSVVLPEPARVGISNFFTNLTFPVRFVNCLLQAKIEGACNEFGGFLVNSIAGMGGFFDVAKEMGFKKYDEDLDQSLAKFGFGPGFYVNLPLLGPSTLRGTFSSVGDGFLDPIWYLDSSGARWAAESVNVVNRTSLSIGDYESLKKAALDPYVALRDAYYQNRLKKIKE